MHTESGTTPAWLPGRETRLADKIVGFHARPRVAAKHLRKAVKACRN